MAGICVGQSQSVPPSADPRDISGVWFGAGNLDPGNGSFKPVDGGDPPFTPKGRSILERRQAAAAAGKPVRSPSDECMPHGVPAIARTPTPFQIIQTAGQTTFIHEAGRTVRLIYMDERQPAHPPVTFMGHSVGRWSGDTLVVDTIALRPNWLDVTGAPAGADMHVIERYRKLDGGRKLEDLITIDDPEMYMHPWTARREYFWRPNERVEEYVCEESLRVEPGVEHGAGREKTQRRE